MVSYVNVHAVLDGRRNQAKASPESSQVLILLFLFDCMNKVGVLRWCCC